MAHVAIDKDNLVFLRRMENQVALRNLINIEYTDVYTAIVDDDSSYSSFTSAELKKLIKNSNGPDVERVFSHYTLGLTLVILVKGLPVFKADAFQLDLQSRAIHPEDGRRYKFVPGGGVPQLVEGDEPYTTLRYTGEAFSAPLGSPASAPQPVAQGVVAANASTPGIAPAASASTDDFAQPKPGTSTHQIFMFCMGLWNAAERTNSEPELKKIREKAVSVLTAQGLNVSTVRTQAMRWYHNRQRFAG